MGQFSSKDLGNFCKIHSIRHLTSPSYHPRSNGLAERFLDVSKRAIKKASGNETVNEELQKFLSIYHIIPNVNTISGMAPAELMFARKIYLAFDRLRPTEKKMDERKNINGKHYNPGKKIYFKNYKFEKATWEDRTTDKRIGKMLYLIKDPK